MIGGRRVSELNADELFLLVLLSTLGALVGTIPGVTFLEEKLPQLDEADAPAAEQAPRSLDIALREDSSVVLAFEGGEVELPALTPRQCPPDLHNKIAEKARGLLAPDVKEATARIQGAADAPFCTYIHVQTALRDLATEHLVAPAVVLVARTDP